MALLETLWDDFASRPVSQIKWGWQGPVTFTAGQAVLPGDPGGTLLESIDTFTFGTGTDASHLIAKVAMSGGATSFELQVSDTTGQGIAAVGVNAGNLYRRHVTSAGGVTTTNITAYNPTSMAYLRLRVVGTAHTVGYSNDGLTWTDIGAPALAFANYTACRARITHGTTNPAHLINVDLVNRPPASALVDEFLGSALNSVLWQANGINGDIIVSGGLLSLVCNNPATSSFAEIFSTRGDYRLSNDAIYVKVTPNQVTNTFTEFMVTNPVTTRYCRIRCGPTTISLIAQNDAGTSVINTAPAYNTSTWAYWRIRMAATSIYIDRSPDGTNWTQNSVGTSVTWGDTVRVSMRQGNSNATNTPPHTSRWDAVNALGGAQFVETVTVTDPETLGQPAIELPYVATATPTGITDPDTPGNPTILQAQTATPGGINDPETLGEPFLLLPLLVTPDGIEDPETFGLPEIQLPLVLIPDGIEDPETLAEPEISLRALQDNPSYGVGDYGYGLYYGSLTPPDTTCTPNPEYGVGTYNCGIYPGHTPADPSNIDLFGDYPTYAPPLHIIGVGPWSPRIYWRGVPNYGIGAGNLPARPAIALPPASSKGFTLRLNEGSEARVTLAMQRGAAVVIDEMDTDLWWRRKDPRTKILEVIGRFNCNNVDLSTSDTGVTLSAQFEDWATVLGARLILRYLHPTFDPPLTQWPKGTPVIDILAWALPTNTGLDLSEVTGDNPYDLGVTTDVYELPPGTLIADVFDNLEALSQLDWEWWIETPTDVNKAPKLRFVLGTRGQNKGVVLFDVGSGPTPIAAWTRNSAADSYANALYFTGGGTGTGANAGGGVVVTIPTHIDAYGQRDQQDGNSATGGLKDQITKSAEKKLAKLADRQPTYTIKLTQGFWRGLDHIDVGDTITLIIRLGRELIDEEYRVSEITVDIDENDYEDVTLTLGIPLASADPRSKRSPIMRVLRYLKNYSPSNNYRPPPDP